MAEKYAIFPYFDLKKCFKFVFYYPENGTEILFAEKKFKVQKRNEKALIFSPHAARKILSLPLLKHLFVALCDGKQLKKALFKKKKRKVQLQILRSCLAKKLSQIRYSLK